MSCLHALFFVFFFLNYGIGCGEVYFDTVWLLKCYDLVGWLVVMFYLSF